MTGPVQSPVWPTRTLWKEEIKQAHPFSEQDRGKGKSTKEVKSGRSRQDEHSIWCLLQVLSPVAPFFLQRPVCLPHRPGLQSTHAQGAVGIGGTLQLWQSLLGKLKNLKEGVCRERLKFSPKALMQTINRQIHKAYRKTEQKREGKKVQNTFPKRRGTERHCQ